MSSTNSSDCESCECSQCTFSYEFNHNDHGQCMTNSRHVPMYATMAHPLIYYAQVVQQPSNRRQIRDQPKKDNPFMKAFKWYTQERKALCSENEVAPERGGFASWLDNKYCEYLRDSGQQPNSNEPWAPNTGVTNTCQCPKIRKFRRFKSPWQKRTCPAKDSGDVPQKYPDGSFEYILKPKELSRAASEICYPSPTSAGKSNATIISSHTPCNAESSRRSQSLSDISREKYVYYKHVEAVPLTDQKGTNISCECPQQQTVYPPITKCKQGNLQQKVPEAVQVPSKQQDSRNQPEPTYPCEKENVIVTEPSKGQYSTNQPVVLCMCSQEKAPTVVKLPSCHTEPPQVVEVQLEKISEVVKVLSYHEEAPQVQQETIPKVMKVPSKAKESTCKLCCKYEKKNVPKEVQVPSEDQDPRNLPGPCCICHVKKVPEVVQVPSQCRAIEGSCQCSEKKAVAVCEETQYETAPTPSRSAQDHGPCCCNTCKPAPPPAPQPEQPQIICAPVKVQNRKISSPDTCVAPSVQCDSLPKKQKKVKQCTVATQCGEGIQSKVSSQCQHEIYARGKDNRSSGNQERQVFDSIPIKRESYSTVAVNKETGVFIITKEVAVVNKLTRCLTCASHGAAQTSDHSIRLENDGACSCFPHPLLLKIVYADVTKIE